MSIWPSKPTRVGEGARFTAIFNASKRSTGKPRPSPAKGEPYHVEAEVLQLYAPNKNGPVVDELGLYAGIALKLGLCCALRIGGITVAVISLRAQAADPVFFHLFGLDIGAAHTVVVKSRGVI